MSCFEDEDGADRLRQHELARWRRLHEYAVIALCLGRPVNNWLPATFEALVELHAAGLLPERLAWRSAP